MYLEEKHPCERDKHITFHDPTHSYSVQGNEDYISVTTLIHQFFPVFDAVKEIETLMLRPDWQYSPYFGLASDKIIERWTENRDEAAQLGTNLHNAIEQYFNKEEITHLSKPYPIEFGTFFLKNYVRDYGYLEPYRTEWRIWDIESRVAGSIDMVYKDPTDKSGKTLMIFDWKRNKDIDQRNLYGTFALDPISSIPNTKYHIHSLQLSMYRYILEKNYGKVVSRLSLVVLHPDNKNYMKIDIPYYKKEIMAMLEVREWFLYSGAAIITTTTTEETTEETEDI